MADSRKQEIEQAQMNRSRKDKKNDKFWYDPEKKTVMGRTCRSWGEIGVFYLCFYTCLGGFVVAFMAPFYATRDDDKPRYNYFDEDRQHPMLNQPGLSQVPRTGSNERYQEFSPRIQFQQADRDTIDGYIEELQEAVQAHNTNVTLMDCDGSSPLMCSLNRADLGECDGVSDPDFGYSSGQPCVMLKLNKIIGWVPDLYTSNPDPERLGDRWRAESITVHCEQEFTYDAFCSRSQCTMGHVEYYPSAGFPSACFPYCGVDSSFDYPTAIVMVKFFNATEGERVAVNCRAWARNLDFARMDKGASVRFSIIVNDSITLRPSVYALLAMLFVYRMLVH